MARQSGRARRGDRERERRLLAAEQSAGGPQHQRHDAELAAARPRRRRIQLSAAAYSITVTDTGETSTPAGTPTQTLSHGRDRRFR